MKDKRNHASMPLHTDLKVCLDRLQFMNSAEVKKQLDPDLTKRIKLKQEKENQEKRMAEEEKRLLTTNAGLAKSVLGLSGRDGFGRLPDSSVRNKPNAFRQQRSQISLLG